MSPSEEKAALVIPDHLARVFRSALSLPEGELRRLNDWARSNISSLVAGDFDPETVSEQLGISLASVYPAAQAITSVLFLSEPPGTPDLETLTPSLNRIGENYAAKAKVLLDGIGMDPSDAEYVRQRGYISQVVLPTLEGLTAVCDLRGVFRNLPSASSLLGFEPIAILGLELSDGSGNSTTSTVQVNEKGLRTIIRTLEQCMMQLEILREHHKTFVRSEK